MRRFANLLAKATDEPIDFRDDVATPVPRGDSPSRLRGNHGLRTRWPRFRDMDRGG